jgi:hypothetical protein
MFPPDFVDFAEKAIRDLDASRPAVQQSVAVVVLISSLCEAW